MGVGHTAPEGSTHLALSSLPLPLRVWVGQIRFLGLKELTSATFTFGLTLGLCMFGICLVSAKLAGLARRFG